MTTVRIATGAFFSVCVGAFSAVGRAQDTCAGEQTIRSEFACEGFASYAQIHVTTTNNNGQLGRWLVASHLHSYDVCKQLADNLNQVFGRYCGDQTIQSCTGRSRSSRFILDSHGGIKPLGTVRYNPTEDACLQAAIAFNQVH